MAKRYGPEQKAEIFGLYLNKRLSTVKIAKIFGCHPATINKILNEVPGTIRNRYEAKRLHSPEERAEIRKIYAVGLFSTGQIGRAYRCHDITISGALHEVPGIMRSQSEQRALAGKRRRRYDSYPEYPGLPAGGRKRFYAKELMGGKCVECGEDDLRVLLLHHIKHDGNEHREEIGSRASNCISLWVINNLDEAKQKLIVLCANCHFIEHCGIDKINGKEHIK